jgi:hypothetical protein
MNHGNGKDAKPKHWKDTVGELLDREVGQGLFVLFRNHETLELHEKDLNRVFHG